MTYVTPADVGVSDDYQDHLNRNSAEPGTDYKTAYGTDIRIAGDGVVALVDNSNQGPEGRRLQINMNNGEVIDYIHGANIRAYVGQPVEKGQRGVFITGASGYGNDWYYGPHVHVTRRLKKGLAFKDSVDFELALDKPQTQEEDEPMLYIAVVKDSWYLVQNVKGQPTGHLLGSASEASKSGIPIIRYVDDWAVTQLKKTTVLK